MTDNNIKNIDYKTLTDLKSGKEAAFEQIYLKYSARIYYFAKQLLLDKTLAEDITQQVFLKIWEKREEIDPEKSFSAYLFQISKHLVYNETERMIRESRFLSNLNEKESVPYESIDARFSQDFIDQLIEELPESRRKIFLLSRKQGLSNKEIADKLSISVKTVETQIRRAVKFLKEKSMGHLLWITLIYISKNL